MTGALRVVQRNALVYRHVWRGSLFSSFLQPTLFLLAMGIGVGRLVDASAGSPLLPNGVSFLEFLAPGMLAAACMQAATFESTWQIHGKMHWRRTYEAITATPVRVRDVVLGEVGWIGLRLVMVAAVYAAVMAVFGVGRGRLMLLAIPAGVLTGVAFTAPLVAYAGALKQSEANTFNLIYRFVITPLFLFSGVFFPIARLPEPLQIVAWFTPLFHGVELVRGLTLGTLESPAWLVHVAYLSTMVAAGVVAGVWTFARQLRA